ncbi:hypothetical protein Tco_1368245 [Tanacetum coccineum]
MFEPVATDLLWQFEAPIKSWKMYKSCKVNCLSMEGMIIYMLNDVEYPFQKTTLKRKKMLEHKCEEMKLNEDKNFPLLVYFPTARFPLLEDFPWRTVPLFDTMIVQQGEGSENQLEPHHTPSTQHVSPPLPTHTSSPHEIQSTPPEAQTTPQASLPHTTNIPSHTPTPKRMTKRAIRISRSKALSLVADETVHPIRGDRYGEAFPTATSLYAGQDRENIPKTSAMPHESFPRVTSLGGDEGILKQKLKEFMEFCITLQSQQTQMAEKIQSQDLEIKQLKAMIQTLEDAQKPREGVQEDAPNKGGIDQGEVNVFKGDAEKDSSRSTDKGNESTGDLANVLSFIGAANILASGSLKEIFTTASPQVPPVSSNVSTAIVTASEKDPTAEVLTTARDTTPYTRRPRASREVVIRSTSPIPISIPSAGKEDKRKGKEIMTEPEKPAKAKVQEQMSLQLARELQEEFVHEDQSIREQIERDAEIARIHAEEDLRQMINELDRSNVMINKHMAEYEEAENDLTIEEKTELITELINYQKDFARIKKYQAQQQRLASKSERRKFYTSVLRSHAGWKTKDFRGMTFDQLEEKFIPVWESIQDFVPMDSKKESESLKRSGILLEKVKAKRLKTSDVSAQEQQESDNQDEIINLQQWAVLVREETSVNITPSVVKVPICDWKIYKDKLREVYQIFRVGLAPKVMFEPVATDLLWQFEAPIKSWKLYKSYETAPPTRVDRYGEAFPTATSLDGGKDRENIPKTSAIPHESFPRVTSLGGDEGSLKQKLKELIEFYTILQSQQTQMAEKIQS